MIESEIHVGSALFDDKRGAAQANAVTKARIGLPEQRNTLTTNPRIQSRASQSQMACQPDNRFMRRSGVRAAAPLRLQRSHASKDHSPAYLRRISFLTDFTPFTPRTA